MTERLLTALVRRGYRRRYRQAVITVDAWGATPAEVLALFEVLVDLAHDRADNEGWDVSVSSHWGDR